MYGVTRETRGTTGRIRWYSGAKKELGPIVDAILRLPLYILIRHEKNEAHAKNASGAFLCRTHSLFELQHS